MHVFWPLNSRYGGRDLAGSYELDMSLHGVQFCGDKKMRYPTAYFDGTAQSHGHVTNIPSNLSLNVMLVLKLDQMEEGTILHIEFSGSEHTVNFLSIKLMPYGMFSVLLTIGTCSSAIHHSKFLEVAMWTSVAISVQEETGKVVLWINGVSLTVDACTMDGLHLSHMWIAGW